MPVGIEMRADIDGVLADLTSYTRIIYRLERRDSHWPMSALECVYERDTLTPAVPGQQVAVPACQLAPYRKLHALLAWHVARRGYEVGTGLLGDDQPERTAALYADTLPWLRD